jgi:hypothetical protein
VLAAPEQLAVEYKARHAEHPDRLGGMADAVDLHAAGARRIIGKLGDIGTGFRQHAADHAGILDVELALPEAFEGRVVISPEHIVSLALRVQHAA